MSTKTFVKRKLSTECEIGNDCCRKLSVFACTCAVLSMLLSTYNYIERDNVLNNELGVITKNQLKNVLEEEIELKIEAYFTRNRDTTSSRVRRDAMLVCFLLFVTIVSNIFKSIYL